MAWVYLDDQFADHPKVVAAGDAAAWLYVCGLAYCKRYDTGGIIPKAQVPKLTGARSVNKLTAALLAAPAGYGIGLWEDCGDHYRVHDYEEWNKPQKSRSEAGRKAAKARWEREARNNGTADASDNDAERNANAYANASPDAMPQDAHHPIPNPVKTSSSDTSGSRPDEDDEEPPPHPADTAPPGQTPPDPPPQATAALEHLADADLRRRQDQAHLAPLGNPSSWRETALETRRRKHLGQVTKLATEQPELSGFDLAAEVDPQAMNPPPGTSLPSGPDPWGKGYEYARTGVAGEEATRQRLDELRAEEPDPEANVAAITDLRSRLRPQEPA